MFEVKTNDSDILKSIISSISTVVEEATFTADSEGLTFRGMDPSHVALVDISLPKEVFDEYKCDSDIKFGVRIDELGKLIKRADKKDKIVLGLTSDNLLSIDMGTNKKYKIRLIESEDNETPVPNIPYDSKFTITSKRFDEILGDVDVIADYINIKVIDSELNFTGRGDSGDVSIDVGNDGVESIEGSREGFGTYSLEYLMPMIKAMGTSAGFTICYLSNNKPLKVEFRVADVGVVRFYLAPRVSQD